MALNNYIERQLLYYVVVFSFLLICGCQNAKKNNARKELYIDTTKSFKIDNVWVTPKPDFEFNTLIKASNDTLDIVSCSNYVLYPFGKINNKSELKSSLLKGFNKTDKLDTMKHGNDTWVFENQVLTLNSNKLVLSFVGFEDSEASPSSYISYGQINDSSIVFSNNIRIGMNTPNFYEIFFEHFPRELQSRYKVIILDYCVDEFRHTYYFTNGKLFSVKFEHINTGWN